MIILRKNKGSILEHHELDGNFEDLVDRANQLAATKADQSAVDAALQAKADATAVNAALQAKADAATVNAALQTKADVATVNAALQAKADQSALNTAVTNLQSQLAGKANSGDLAPVALSGDYADLENKPSPTGVEPGSIGTTELADRSVTLAKIAQGTTPNALIGYDAAGNPAEITPLEQRFVDTLPADHAQYPNTVWWVVEPAPA